MSKKLHRPFPMWSPRWQDPSQRLDTAKSGNERYLGVVHGSSGPDGEEGSKHAFISP